MCRMPSRTSVACDYVRGVTFPTRSERHVGTRKMKKVQNTSKRKINFTSGEIEETLSEENTSPWKCKQRYMFAFLLQPGEKTTLMRCFPNFPIWKDCQNCLSQNV